MLQPFLALLTIAATVTSIGCKCQSITECGEEFPSVGNFAMFVLMPQPVSTTSPNNCELDLDFGAIPVGSEASVTIQIDEVGGGPLRLSPIVPTEVSGFAVTDGGNSETLPMGGVGFLSIAFHPGASGEADAQFVIQTDGQNADCFPLADAGGSTMTIKATGSAAAR